MYAILIGGRRINNRKLKPVDIEFSTTAIGAEWLANNITDKNGISQ
jgi:hypothetical protein